MKILILGLGNELLSDDGAGLLAARALSLELQGQAEVIECSLSGLALLEVLMDYDRAIILDATASGKHPPGTIIELFPDDLSAVISPSPHYAGLPEMLALAKQLEVDFPSEIAIFALEVADPYTIGGGLSEKVREALPGLCALVRERVSEWVTVEKQMNLQDG
ncbi:MAG TPA: hydrogenase maturation protease [Armatimonadota bacterium]